MKIKFYEKWWKNNTRYFSIKFYSRYFLTYFLRIHSNGAVKGKDKCLDLSVWVLGVRFNYINTTYDII